MSTAISLAASVSAYSINERSSVMSANCYFALFSANTARGKCPDTSSLSGSGPEYRGVLSKVN